MRKFFKWLGIIVLSLAVIAIIAVVIMVNRYKNMAKVSYEVSPAPIEIPTDSASLVRGAVLGNAICTGCHGGDSKRDR